MTKCLIGYKFSRDMVFSPVASPAPCRLLRQPGRRLRPTPDLALATPVDMQLAGLVTLMEQKAQFALIGAYALHKRFLLCNSSIARLYAD
jgi:hypothetical protein